MSGDQGGASALSGRLTPIVQRLYSLAAPENTLAAVRKAIDSGADYAEVDVQQTADGVVVLLHDTDLKRVGRVSSRIGDLTFDEARRLDVGSHFAPSYSGERIPTLDEVIALSRGKIRLNIELKTSGQGGALARAVGRIVREEDFAPSCLVTSFDRESLLELRRSPPSPRTGLIIAQALGDVSRLEFDALSVRADWLTQGVLRAAHRAGKEVHVWTVNDPREMARLMKMGVDNVITDDPDAMIRVRDGWARLSAVERLLLASSLLLGVDP